MRVVAIGVLVLAVVVGVICAGSSANSFATGGGLEELLGPSYVWSYVDNLSGVRIEADCRTAIQTGTDEITVTFVNFEPKALGPYYKEKPIESAEVVVNGFRFKAKKVGSIFSVDLPRGWSDQGGPLDVSVAAYEANGHTIVEYGREGIEVN